MGQDERSSSTAPIRQTQSVILTGATLTFVAASWLLVAIVGRESQLMIGMAIGLYIGFLMWLFARDPAAPLFDGADAEAWTSRRLRKLRRQGWHVVDDVSFFDGNIDHVLVGPAGVFAIETKFVRSAWKLEPDRLRGGQPGWDPFGQARWSARKIWLFLKSEGIDAAVQPVVVFWGPASFEWKNCWR